jgi:YqaJ-like viral recombinase domain
MDKVDAWFLQRWGRYTGSEIFKLLTPPPINKVWSPGAMTYIEQKAIECISDMWERPELEEVGSLLYGKVHELPAYEAYLNATKNYSMTYMGSESPIFLVYEPLAEEAGATPDAANILSEGNIDVGVEIKNPKNPVYHFRRLKWKDQFDLKEGYPLCYAQCQFLLIVTGAYEWHFVSYDERQKIKSKKIKIIEVKPDQKFQDNLEVKLRMAVKEKYKILSDHLETTVTCRKDVLKLQ